jgi:serine protease
MAQSSFRWLMGGAALLALGACDAISSRAAQFGELAGQVAEQINVELMGGAPSDPFQAASPEDRALAGVQSAPVELADVSLDEMLQTQSFFAVGSIIAKPKVELAEPVVEPDTFDLEAAQPDPAPEPSAEPVAEAQAEPDPLAETPAATAAAADAPEQMQEASPLPPPAAVEPPAGARRTLRVLGAEQMQKMARVDPGVLRERAEEAPRALERAIKEGGVAINREALEAAREMAEQATEVQSDTAQQVGDEIARQAQDAEAPVPKALAVRSKLNVEAALTARERAYQRLERLGVSGVVTPEEGGAMRITLDVKPMQLPSRIDPTRIDTVRELFAGTKTITPETCETVTQVQMQADAVLATECVAEALAQTGDYEYVEKDYIFSHQMLRRPKKAVTFLPNDTLFNLQWHLRDAGAGEGQSAGGASFRNFWAREKTTGSRNVTVAVVDTGLQMQHPDIKGSPNVAQGYDMVSDPVMGNDGDGRDANPDDPGDKCDPNDATVSDTFHGTHVAGSIGAAATNNGSGVAGGAWNVTIVPVRALGRCGGRLSDINDAIRWAAGKVPARNANGEEVWNKHPADIINLSLGLFEPCPASMQAAIDDAVAAGALVVAAAGNARIDTKYFAPASCRNVITVAAADARGVMAPYSNFGAEVALLAPGGDLSRDDDKDGRPDGILSTKLARDCYDPANPATKLTQCFYAYENGTSMAAPQVSAALALLKAKFPTAVPSELRARLLAATSPRTDMQCSGKCTQYPGSTPIPGQDGMCLRACGARALNLANGSTQ